MTPATDRPAFGTAEHQHLCRWIDEKGTQREHWYAHRNGECLNFLYRPCHHEVAYPTISSRLFPSNALVGTTAVERIHKRTTRRQKNAS